MTGIERLRELAQKHRIIEHYLTADTIDSIADQIERETQPKRDPAADVSMSAYDLLPKEDRDAIAWVREHGGVETIIKQRRDSVPRAAFERKLGKRLRHIAECEEALRRRNATISALEKTADLLRKQIADMRPRVMPEGMEWLVEAWPRFEDDAPVRFLDDFERYGDENGVSVVTMYSDGSFALNCRAYSKGEHVKRPDFHNSTKVNARLTSHSPAPAPKVLDADGAEIRVGDTVWDVEYGCEHVVTKVSEGTVFVAFEDESADRYDPASLTHRSPVLAADGRPLREGEHVWHVETGTELVVKELPKPGAYQAVVVFAPPASHLTSFDPDQLTHERPVNHCFECSHWQAEPGRDRLGVCWDTYGERECEDSYAAVLGTSEACAQFERRAKALAGRGQ